MIYITCVYEDEPTYQHSASLNKALQSLEKIANDGVQ
jgi:hypothetical protein